LHELGVVFEVIKAVEDFAQENAVSIIDTVVLQIGELSSMIPKYIEACFPAAVDGTSMRDAKLVIEILPGNGICRHCAKVFNLLKCGGACPACKSRDWDLLGGKEFLIKEIIAR